MLDIFAGACSKAKMFKKRWEGPEWRRCPVAAGHDGMEFPGRVSLPLVPSIKKGIFMDAGAVLAFASTNSAIFVDGITKAELNFFYRPIIRKPRCSVLALGSICLAMISAILRAPC